MIQIDMEMPKSCGGCKMSATDVCLKWLGLKRYELGSKRAIDCPLKEVPTGKWIPVSERLPAPYMFVNATCRSLVDDRDNWVVETIYLPIPKEYNPRHYSDWGNIPMLNWREAEVIAWMERIIPEPYKMVEEQQGEDTDAKESN